MSDTAMIVLSDEQKAIAQFVDSGSGNLIVRARAGTGKTSLILQCLPLMRGSKAIFSYSNKIVGEIREKVSSAGHRGVDVSTFHSIGGRVLRKLFPNSKLEGNGTGRAGYKKFTRIANELEIPEYLRAFVEKAMEMAMMQGVGIDGLMSAKDITAWQHLVSHYGIDTEIADDNVIIQIRNRDELILEGLRFAHKALNLGKKIAHEVHSFNDMLWIPLILNAPFPSYDWVCVDEAQDSSPARREIAKRVLKSSGRLMAVGDNFQSIFSFAGANSDSLDIIERDFNCKVFPMTLTFRCSQAVVRLAQKLVPDYRAAPGNVEGLVDSISEGDFNQLDLIPGRDAVICRNTKPLIKVAYSLIKRGIPAHIEGREIGAGLLALTNRWANIKTIPALVTKLEDYRTKQIAKLTAANQEMKAEALSDQIDSVLAIIDGLPKGATLADLRNKIDSMFSDTPAGEKASTVSLMTAHRSKGLEFFRVFNYQAAKLMPSKRAVQPHEIEQEHNIIYVSITRAIHTYIEVN
ncbi:unnamed protein product [Sphagnum tenellum]